MFVFGGYIDMRGASDELWQYELGKCHSKNDVDHELSKRSARNFAKAAYALIELQYFF